ncbi:class I SAM-dependent methyltransferase [Mycobacterium hodleri]|uniref:Class I SAM-dependent methyltransferase n=2 Tax=Mycolicibacterium hodleri TaxID=49897 RepID=A0A502DRW9_9MYCO|nr:class I SAM-dependent methyltransferase [Mycolicibacterium hodleri]
MAAEFDTLAEWTAQVATDLGSSFKIPAACRGSGSLAVLDWLIDELHLSHGGSLLDCGAGMGGPAAYAVRQRSVRPLLVEPERGACRAARSLFGHPVVRASALALPVGDDSFDAAWSLGVLCTVPDQLALLTELRRVVRPTGRIGLLVFVARSSEPFPHPDGNHFPTEARLLSLVEKAGLGIEDWRGTEEMAGPTPEWQSRVEKVTAELADRHRGQRAWQLAERQSQLIGQLLADSTVTGELLTLRRR